jgi:formate C-acetyltransferase
MAPPKDQVISFGDHNCRVDTGEPFPFSDEMPSKKNGFEWSEMNWAIDYAFFLDHSPAEIYEHEIIVGEMHWNLEEARLYKYPDECQQLGFEARKVGAGGFSLAHTCPDLSIGIKLGWPGILKKIRENKAKYEQFGNTKSAGYLAASEVVVEAIIRFVEKHSRRAWELYEAEEDLAQKELYRRVAQNCHMISQGPPLTFEQGIQWINLFFIVERINGHGNGYGRFDQFMYDLYKKDMVAGRINREAARELIAEQYLKYGASYFSFGGRNEKLEDATNELSWVALEAYDMLGGYNHLGVMWHSDMDKAYFRYACEVVARHGAGTPTLVSYDVLRQSELFSGFSEEDAWNVSYSGCQWYCAVGREYQDQDVNCMVLIQPMQRAMKNCIEKDIQDFEGFWEEYDKEVNITADALVKLKNAQYAWQHKVWPEMITSTCMHGPIERGRDVTDIRAVDNNYTSVNVLGVPNVVDSIYAMKKLVFEDRLYSMGQLQEALDKNWDNEEEMRQRFLNADKFGNDIDEVDAIAVRVAEHIRFTLENKRNIKGFHFRPSLFQFMGHTYAGPFMGATPDGRKAEEFLAHGMNPMHGRNVLGISATANSLCKIDLSRYQGGSLQIELDPISIKTVTNLPEYVDNFALSFFEKNGVQINLNLVSLKELKKAMDDPENPKYQNIVVKVTGYSAHFVAMDRKLQKEFVERVNYVSI